MICFAYLSPSNICFLVATKLKLCFTCFKHFLFFLFQHARIVAKLERAEINPKKRLPPGNDGGMAATSTDVFKINLVYKDAKGSEHELRWLIKVTRSDVNGVADNLLRHEKTVYSRSGALTQSNSVAFLLSVGGLFGTTKSS